MLADTDAELALQVQNSLATENLVLAQVEHRMVALVAGHKNTLAMYRDGSW